jgi:hypothetical protein
LDIENSLKDFKDRKTKEELEKEAKKDFHEKYDVKE